jgi:hypothetical protein
MQLAAFSFTTLTACGLPSLIARRYAASLPLARSLEQPGSLGDAVGRFLLHYSYRYPVGLLLLIVRR